MEEKHCDARCFVKIKILIKENMQDSNPRCFEVPVFCLQNAIARNSVQPDTVDGGTCRGAHSSAFLSTMRLNNEVI